MKAIVLGTLIGILFGILSYFVFPSLINIDLKFNQAVNQQFCYNLNYFSAKSGSALAIGILMPTIFGLLGALIEFMAFKLNGKK